MGKLPLHRIGRLPFLGAAVFLYSLMAGCTGDGEPRDYEGQVTLRVEESWEVLVELPTRGFLDTVGRNADEFADTAGKGTAVVGCVAGGVTLVVLTQGQGGEAGCMVGGFALYPVGYAVGYGTGAFVGTVQGAINLLADSDDEIDTRALLTVFESTAPRIDLANSMLARSQHLSLIRLAWSDEPEDTTSGVPPTERDSSLQLTLTITRLWLTTSTARPPTSRLQMAVRGELTDLQTGQVIQDDNWSYESELLSTAELTLGDAEALRSELVAGWSTLAGEIIFDLFERGRS